MKNSSPLLNEQLTETAFSNQSRVFDVLYSKNAIIDYKRTRVRSHLSAYLPEQSTILELNSGTGLDAIYFASLGHHVHATDLSTGMQHELNSKIAEYRIKGITTEVCSYTQLERLKDKGPFDAIFSNFAGLNCTAELGKVLESFAPLLKTGGLVTMVILPKFCLWEGLLLFRGKFKTAFRRFSPGGTSAHVEGVHFKCWYYNPSFIKTRLKGFQHLKTEGLCTIVPPSYIEQFVEKHPALYSFLQKAEDRLKTSWPWRSIGDYYIISFRKE